MKCPSHSRTQLIKEQVEEWEQCMSNSETDPAITFWIPKYILMQNAKALSTFTNLP